MGAAEKLSAVRALVLSDGVAGHDRINLGVLAALRRRRTVEERWLGVREFGSRSRGLDRALARVLPFDRFWAARFAATDAGPTDVLRVATPPSGRLDVVISAGPSTGAANLAVARRTGARSIFFGFPKLPLIPEFDVLLRPDRPRFGLTQGVTALRPSEIDPDELPAPRRGQGALREIAVLVGGDTKHYAFQRGDFESLAVGLKALSGVRTTVFNSRRTPPALFDRFVAAFAADGAERVVIDVRTGGFRSNAAAYAADLVVVTADSMSMIAEAIAARRPTLIARPDAYRPPKRDAAEIAEHVGARLAAEIDFAAFASAAWLDAAEPLRPLPYHPLDRLADIVATALEM